MAKLRNLEGRAITTWPGKELHEQELRELATMLCREQGWRYEYHGGGRKPRLYNPDGDFMTLPLTPSSYGSVLSTKNKLRRLGADLDRSVPRRSFVGESLRSDDTETPWTETEWRERQASAADWRQKIAGYTPPPPKPEPVPLTGYGAELMSRLTGAAEVRADAQGNGDWSLAAARQLLRDGYSLNRVIERTGWGRMWLADLADRLAAG